MIDLSDIIDLPKAIANEQRAMRIERGGYSATLREDIDEFAIDGQPLRFDTPFDYNGGWVMFRPYAFGDLNASTVELRCDHIESLAFASTCDGSLELIADDEGLQFRVDLRKAQRGHVLASMCKSGSRDATSIACELLQQHSALVDNRKVSVVTKARLTEISLCSVGQEPSAFAVLVDKTVTAKPVAGYRSDTFALANKMHNVSRGIKLLKQKISISETETPPRPVYTMADSFRWQAEETERLQQINRHRHLCY